MWNAQERRRGQDHTAHGEQSSTKSPTKRNDLQRGWKVHSGQAGSKVRSSTVPFEGKTTYPGMLPNLVAGFASAQVNAALKRNLPTILLLIIGLYLLSIKVDSPSPHLLSLSFRFEVPLVLLFGD
jgi:hypothetical protein